MLSRVLAVAIGLLAGSCDGEHVPCNGECTRHGSLCWACGGVERCGDAGEECQASPEVICEFCSGWQTWGNETCAVEGDQAVVRCE